MSQYHKSPEEYASEERAALSRFIKEERSKLGTPQKEPHKTSSDEALTGVIGFGLGAVVWVAVSAIENHATSIFYFLIPMVAFFLIKKSIYNSKVQQANIYQKQVQECEQRINAKEKEINDRIQKYSQEYLLHHTKKIAIDMASSEAVKAIAGQLSLLFKKEIDEADRNGYIKTIDVIMELEISTVGVNYVFWQKGTVSPKPRKKAYFSFQEFGAKNLNKQEECNGAARAISSMIQTSLLEKYITNDPTPTVTVENKSAQQYFGDSKRIITHENEFIIAFSQHNEKYEGERGWI